MRRILRIALAACLLLTSLYAAVLEPGPADWRPHRYGHQPRRRYVPWPTPPAAKHLPPAAVAPPAATARHHQLVQIVPAPGREPQVLAEMDRVGASAWRGQADVGALQACLASEAIDALQPLPVIELIVWLGWCDPGVSFPPSR